MAMVTTHETVELRRRIAAVRAEKDPTKREALLDVANVRITAAERRVIGALQRTVEDAVEAQSLLALLKCELREAALLAPLKREY